MPAQRTSGKQDGYNRFKDFEGKRYTGMKIGRTHHWHYDQGDWKEKKLTPDKWELTYSTIKRRTGHAPEGSGVPVGTGYHWFILSHQYVEKLSANDYMTHMVGLKFKLAHKRADKGEWNASSNAQRKSLITILKNIIAELEKAPEQMTPVPLSLNYKDTHYEGTAIPVLTTCDADACTHLDITLNKQHVGILRFDAGKWKMSELKSQGLVNAIGAHVTDWYGQHAA